MAVNTAQIVDDKLCKKSGKAPPSSRTCNKKLCPYTWSHTDWTNVSMWCNS